MNNSKRQRLESEGWKIGSTQEFLELSDEEMTYIELKLSLSQSLKKQRQKKKFTQTELAKIMKSSQSRVAKMEAGDPSVSLDLIIRSLLTLGVSKEDLARSIEKSSDALRHKIAS